MRDSIERALLKRERAGNKACGPTSMNGKARLCDCPSQHNGKFPNVAECGLTVRLSSAISQADGSHGGGKSGISSVSILAHTLSSSSVSTQLASDT